MATRIAIFFFALLAIKAAKTGTKEPHTCLKSVVAEGMLIKDTDHSLPCARPDAMTEETLAQTLQSRGLLTSGTAQERVARLEEADRTCTMPVTGKKMVFPSFTNEALAREVYVTLAAGCLGIEACIDVPIIIPGAMNYSRAVHFSVELDLRTPTLKVQFESCHHEILLFDNNIDFQEDFKLSDFTFLKLRLKKGDGDKWYTLGLGLKLQLGLDLPAIIDAMVVEDFHLHIPSISDFSLPGDGSLRGLAKLTGNRLSFGAVRFFLKTLKLDNILTEGKCEDYELTEPDCPWNIDVHKFLPDSLKDKVTCVMTPNCLGIQCCHEVSLKLPLMSTPLTMQLPFSFVFSPCDNMKVRVAVGSFSKEEQLLNYELGQTRELTIGKGQYDGEPSPLTIKYAISHYRKVEPKYEEGFLLDLKVRLCLPFDGKSICFPTDEDDGFDVLTKQKVPVCSPDTLAEIKSETEQWKQYFSAEEAEWFSAQLKKDLGRPAVKSSL